MKTVAVVHPSRDAIARLAEPVAEAFTKCFAKHGWKVEHHSKPIEDEPDLVAGYGWREVMADAYSKWPDKVLHVDGAFWSRHREVKLAMGGRWSPVSRERKYDAGRMMRHPVNIAPTRRPGRRVLVCGMSAKAAISWGMEPQQWEHWAVKTLVDAGAEVTYRPKRANEAREIAGAKLEDSSRVSIQQSLEKVDAVATHHSNVAIDAIAAGLPIYAETGIAEICSAGLMLDELVGAEALSIEERASFLHEVAWHQWTLEEIAAGVWMKPPAPLSDNPLIS